MRARAATAVWAALAAAVATFIALTAANVLPCGGPLQRSCESATTSRDSPLPAVALAPLPAPAPGAPLFPPAMDGHLPYGLNTSAIELNHDDPSHRHGASAEAIGVIEQDMGATLARVNLFWPTIEQQRHRYEWDYYDAIYRSLTSHGVRPIWTIVKTPRFYVPPLDRLRCLGRYCDMEPAPRYQGELAHLSRLVAQRYPLSAAIELRNEPNNPPTPNSSQPSIAPDVYAAELAQVFKGTRASNTTVRVLGGALGDTNRVGYLEAMLRAGAGAAMDGLSFHPYDESADFRTFHTWFDDLQTALRAGGHEDLRLVPDETGVSTDHGDVTDGFKAERILQIYRALDGRDSSLPLVDQVDAVVFFTAIDQPGPAHGYGWFLDREESADHDLSPKAVYCAFRRQAGGFTTPFVGTVGLPGERIDGCPG